MGDCTCRLSAAYRAPAVRVGQRLYCSRREEFVVVTNFTRGPARWPVGRPEGGGGGGPSVVVCHDLLVAALREKAATLQAWLGVSHPVASKLRRLVALRYAAPPPPQVNGGQF